MSGKGKNLSEKERRFVEAYMGEAAGNGAEAARLAGYAISSARQTADRLMSKADIKAAISKRQEADPLVATREDRQRFWTEMMYAKGDCEDAKPADRLRASELLGKASGDFIERVGNPDGSPLRQPSLVLVVKP